MRKISDLPPVNNRQFVSIFCNDVIIILVVFFWLYNKTWTKNRPIGYSQLQIMLFTKAISIAVNVTYPTSL